MKRIIRPAALLLAVCLCLSLAGCGSVSAPDIAARPYTGPSSQSASEPATPTKPKPQAVEPAYDWVVYWYLCGSDLETEHACATNDLIELTKARLPENVAVVIETGGSYHWHNDAVDPDHIQRWLYNSDGLFLLDTLRVSNMGSSKTLQDFLTYASTEFPGRNTALVLWNHGGGSVAGVAFDEMHDYDSLTLKELQSAFSAVWEASPEAPPIDLLGFDACLMATVDVAEAFRGFAHCLVASEEVEPGGGWDYTGWVSALGAQPDMDAATLGRAICDTYYEHCRAQRTESGVTLSVVDLTRIDPLLKAYTAFGAEALTAACNDPGFFSRFARAAGRSENYGGNTREQGYANLVDLGDLARQSSQLLDSPKQVLEALDDCVLYTVNGAYRSQASGLSCYHCYSGQLDDVVSYAALGDDNPFSYYYIYSLTGRLDKKAQQFLQSVQTEQVPGEEALQARTVLDWDGLTPVLDRDGYASLTLGPQAKDILAGICYELYYIDGREDIVMLLGADSDMEADWENGIFYDNFRGVWGAIDGHLVYMEIAGEFDDYYLYSVPILLDGEPYNLQVVYRFDTERWEILGARRGLDPVGKADRQLRLLERGDEITTLWQLARFSGEQEPQLVPADTFRVTRRTRFEETELFDGSYYMSYVYWDAAGNYAHSDPIRFDMYRGEIYTSVLYD